MRLSEAKIKEAILHPEILIRQKALLYFADCYSRDVEVMPERWNGTCDATFHFWVSGKRRNNQVFLDQEKSS